MPRRQVLRWPWRETVNDGRRGTHARNTGRDSFTVPARDTGRQGGSYLTAAGPRQLLAPTGG